MASRRPDLSTVVSLKVDNLPRNCTVEDLRAPFEKYGNVADVYIPLDYQTRSPKSFGFVRFSHKDDADAAVKGLSGFELLGSIIDVGVALYGPSERRRRRSRSRTPPRRYRSRSRSRSYQKTSRRDRSDSRDRHRRSRY